MKPKLRLKNRVTNNFNNEVFETSSTGNDLKAEIRAEARKYNKQITDFITTKI
jgi:hypothetical protein